MLNGIYIINIFYDLNFGWKLYIWYREIINLIIGVLSIVVTGIR